MRNLTVTKTLCRLILSVIAACAFVVVMAIPALAATTTSSHATQFFPGFGGGNISTGGNVQGGGFGSNINTGGNVQGGGFGRGNISTGGNVQGGGFGSNINTGGNVQTR